MLSIKNLTKKYSASDKIAVNNISFDVNEGEIVGFLGPNGAGKSTTIKCLMGILPYEQGEITLDGVSLRDDPITFKKNIGYVSDDHMMYDKLTGREYINFICDIYGVSAEDREARCKKYLELFDLVDAFDRQISTYSHGMKQKMSVISALVHEPKLWVLDEPLMGLDPKSAHDLKELMRAHVEAGNSVFFSSHMLEVVEKVCDRIVIIDNGELLLVSDIDRLHDGENNLEDFFLSVTGDKDMAL